MRDIHYLIGYMLRMNLDGQLQMSPKTQLEADIRSRLYHNVSTHAKVSAMSGLIVSEMMKDYPSAWRLVIHETTL